MTKKDFQIAVIIPVLNEEALVGQIVISCKHLLDYSKVVVVDGGSQDDTALLFQQAGFEVIKASRGRSTQMSTGVNAVSADIYWFLHADCIPPETGLDRILHSIKEGNEWGRFDVRLTGSYWLFRVIERMMNWRSCITGVATGDQGIFVTARLLQRIGGVPDIPLMEDIELTKELRRISKPVCLREKILVSSRKWERHGIIRLTVLMWWLRLRYFLGDDPAKLHRIYYGE